MSFRVSVTVNCALARHLHLLLNMASVCYDCEQQYTSDHFNSITSHSADVSFRQTITHGCLCKLLAWAKAKKQSKKSSLVNTDELPSDLTGIAHAVIKTIHTLHTYRILVLCYENGFIICYGCIYWGTRYRKSVEPVVSIS